MPSNDPVLVDAETLRRAVTDSSTPVILDVRWSLAGGSGYDLYCSGHIPGAVFVDLETELSGPTTPEDGRHPLPDPAVLQKAVLRWGLDAGEQVVIYDDNGSTSAARAWWLLRWAGVQDVRILDGGLQSWVRAGGELAAGPGVPVARGSVTISADRLPTLGIDETAEWPTRGVLVDVRPRERFLGAVEPIDPRAGHIPGARNLPTLELVDDDGVFLPAEQIRARFAEVGVTAGDQATLYCGSGVTACHALAAMEIAGLTGARLFPGSWSQWSNDRARPVELGADDAGARAGS